MRECNNCFQVVFFELGSDLAASNATSASPSDMESSVYGQMLTRTPGALGHLLDACVYTCGKRTYVDFFPFFNQEGMSELNILKAKNITFSKTFE